MNLLRENWPLGWTPNIDAYNGDPKGLLRADNLRLDEEGILSLIRGTKKISSGAFSAPSKIFGRTMNLSDLGGAGYANNSKVRYVFDGTSVLRNYSPATKSETVFDLGIISGGGPAGCAFGFGFGHTFICSGTKKYKDDGINQSPLGIDAPPAPGISVNGPPTVNVSSTATVAPFTESYLLWENEENDSVFNLNAAYVEIDSAPDTYRARAARGILNSITRDFNSLNDIAGTGTSEDIFSWEVRIGDTSKFVKVQVSFLLEQPTAVSYTSDFGDYYEYEWNIQNPAPVFQAPVPPDELEWEDRLEFIENARREFEAANPITFSNSFNLGIDVWSKLSARRGDFKRVGTDDSLDWSDIRGIRVTFVGTEQQTYVFTSMKFIGGSNGPLTGDYVYLQVDVQNNGFYNEKSLPSPVSAVASTIKTSVAITPSTVDPQANECWTFRAGGKLNGFYLIKRQTGAKGFTPGGFTDTYSDTDALRDNIRLDDFQSNLPDDIIGMETNFKGRNWYITYEDLYPSYRDNFSSYDTRYKIENAGRAVEYNLFITKVSADVMILATNIDFYEITGTAGVILQGDVEFFDINIRSLGIKSPSISKEFCVREGNLFYLAADGLRVLAGSNCNLLSDPVDLLFRGETRHGIAPVKILTNLTESYYIGISKSRLLFSTPQTDNKRALYVYDFNFKNWRYEEHGDTDSISALFVEEDDQIIYSTASFGDKFLRILDIGTLFDETTDINFTFRTIYDHNNQPRNRKDSFTFKIVADSLNDNITITVRGFTGAGVTANSNQTKTFTTTSAFNGKQEKIFTIYTDIGLVKYYQVELTGTVSGFKLYNISVDYEPRPEQLSALRIPPSNFGIAGRKRIQEIPMIIDTLGNTVTFAPLLDGIVQTTSTHNTSDKTLATHFFSDEKAAYNIGGLLTGTLFEFYELVPPRNVELLPDPAKYRFVPYTNLGSGARKRFIQYAIVIDTRGINVTMTPLIDGTAQASQVINTIRKQTVIYTFDTFAIGVDVACILQGSALSADAPFEFYEINLSECASEKLPPLASKYTIPQNNLGSGARKRVIQFAFVIDTRNSPVTFIPEVDGVPYPSATYTTSRKQTVIYTFDSFVVGIDIGGTLSGSADFEFYGVDLGESISEKLPPISSNLHITHSNLGTSARKRISQFAFVIDTRGNNVTFTPQVDGVVYATKTFSTNRKETVIYTFAEPTVGVDIGGALVSSGDFEYYGPNLEESVYEKLPAKTKALQISCTNFGIAGKKRIRTIPLVIDTFGHDVVYTPTVDGITFPSSTFNTNRKATVLHYFENTNEGTPFGIDYCGTLIGEFDFEFYELLKPENVETLPVGKKFDQFGPIEFSKIGKIREISIRMVATGTALAFRIYSSDSLFVNGVVTTVPNIERSYVIQVPKGVNPNIFRMEINSTDVFHRFDATVRVNIDGNQTANKQIKIQ